MDAKQQEAMKRCMDQLFKHLAIDSVTWKLKAKGILTKDDMEIIQRKSTTSERRLEFIDRIQSRNSAWESLLRALIDTNQEFLGKAT